jgi:hypothetical protein
MMALGFATAGATFTLAGANGSEPADFDASGSLPTLLINSAGDLDEGPMYSWALVYFSDGSATVSHSYFAGIL